MVAIAQWPVIGSPAAVSLADQMPAIPVAGKVLVRGVKITVGSSAERKRISEGEGRLGAESDQTASLPQLPGLYVDMFT